MKLPSIQYLATQAKSSLWRFPLTLLCATLAVGIGIYLVEYGKNIQNLLPYINTMLVLSLGIPMYFCVTIIAGKKKFDLKKIGIFNLMATLILVAVYFTLPNAESTHNTSLPYIKYGLYNLTCHLLVSIVPFAFSKQLNGFWHYNKILFIRILLSVLYSGFIYIGLIIALTAMRLLFDVKIHEELYFEIWIVTLGVFNTWFFVSGIPKDFDQLDELNQYPKGLKIFSQYVLLPLLSLYLIILYSYGTKILITSDWPKGIVAYLIIFVSIVGILFFLLLQPYGNLAESAWIKKASRGYYFLLIPLLILLYIAIFMRINDYGITINRYAVLILAVWITVVCLYTSFGKTNIKFIPTSLAILTVLISFGPWGMFSVSERSQVNRLKLILENSKILINGKIQNEPIWVKDSLPNLYALNQNKNEGKLKDSIHNEVKSIVEYLDNHHGFASIQSWFQQDLNSFFDLKKNKEKKGEFYFDNEASLYLKSMGLKDEWLIQADKQNFANYSITETEITPITGYDYLFGFDFYRQSGELTQKEFAINDQTYYLSFMNQTQNTMVLKGKYASVRIEVDHIIEKLKNQYGMSFKTAIPEEIMTLRYANDFYEIKFQIKNLNVNYQNKQPKIEQINGQIFIKIK